MKRLFFIAVDIVDHLLESIARENLGSSIPGGTESEALQRSIFQFGEDSKTNCTGVEIFVDCQAQ